MGSPSSGEDDGHQAKTEEVEEVEEVDVMAADRQRWLSGRRGTSVCSKRWLQSWV